MFSECVLIETATGITTNEVI